MISNMLRKVSVKDVAIVLLSINMTYNLINKYRRQREDDLYLIEQNKKSIIKQAKLEEKEETLKEKEKLLVEKEKCIARQLEHLDKMSQGICVLKNENTDENTDEHIDEHIDENTDEHIDEHIDENTDEHIDENTDEHSNEVLVDGVDEQTKILNSSFHNAGLSLSGLFGN